MLTGDEIESLPIGLEKLFRGLEKRVMRDIIRRLKAAGEITRSTDWQIYRSAELGKAIDEIKKEIAETLDGGDEEVNKLFDEAAKTSWARDKKLYKSVGQTPIAYKDNETLKQLVAAVKAQTSDELRNITGTLGVATANKGRIKTVSLTEYFTDTLDNAAFDISSGAFDYNTVLKRTVTELVNSGIRTINYDSVSKRPTTARVDVAARRAVMTGVNQLTAKISEDNAKTLGTDMYEVSAHSCCRPEHVEWQGGWYTMAQLKSVCGYGKVDGLKGANCGHSFDPVIPGISEPSYTPEELQKMRAEESKKHEYNGKEYTKYEASQRQRRLERTIAARRHAVDLLEEGGADEQTIQDAKISFQAVSQEYTRFSKAMGLPQQRERVGTALAGMKYDEPTAPKPMKTDTQTVEIPLDKSEKSGIIKIGIDDFPDYLKDKKESGNTGKLIEFVNSREGADPNVVKLYSKMGKMESLASNDIPIKVSHGSDNAVHTTSQGGKIISVELTIPKIDDADPTGQIATTLHEEMHMIDFFNRSDVEKYAGWFSGRSEKLKKIFQNDDTEIGDDVKKLFKAFHDECDKIKKELNDEFKATTDQLYKKYTDGEITFKEYKKTFTKLQKEMVVHRKSEYRNALGGGVNSLEDIYSALSGGQLDNAGEIKFGHSKDYYQNRESRIKETFAQFGVLSIMRPDLIKILRKDKPDLVDALDDVVKELLKKVGD